MATPDTPVPKFNPEKSLWDLSTFKGRYMHFADFINPKYLLLSKDQLVAADQLLKSYRANGKKAPTGVTDRMLWDAKRAHQSSFAADGTIIPMPFRMCGFIPFNVIVVAGMCNPAQGMATTLFWQWFNQTHNAAINYYNRPSVEPAPLTDMLKPYLLAVGGAMGVVLSAPRLISAISKDVAVQNVLKRVVPFFAVATANVTNVCFMRMGELTSGIPVVTEEGDVVGTSVIAARDALKKTAISRVTLTAPLLLIPPFLTPVFERLPIVKRNKWLTLPFQLSLATVIFYSALPNMLAFYPQMCEIKPSELEEQFHHIDRPILYYNKGL